MILILFFICFVFSELFEMNIYEYIHFFYNRKNKVISILQNKILLHLRELKTLLNIIKLV